MRKRPLGISSLEKPEEAPTSTTLAPRKIVVPKGARPIPVCQATIRKAIVDKNVAATDTKEKNQITQPERPMLATVNVASEEPKQVQPALPNGLALKNLTVAELFIWKISWIVKCKLFVHLIRRTVP